MIDLLQIIYDTSKFGDRDLSFWKTRLFKVDNEYLSVPIEYKYIQYRSCLNYQIPKFREHSFYCSTRRRELEDKTNLYQVAKEQAVYQYTNRKAILKYESQINNFNFLVELKHEEKLLLLQQQKRELKQKLKSFEIDSKTYQRLYTPIRKSKESVNYHIWSLCRNYRNRYFDCGRLKEVYRS
ncbi:MAG: hypothetical protein Q9M43_05645 [Sulfurimonas sp.]|nr:hypothetical protein [Sulfurimonas sp.]